MQTRCFMPPLSWWGKRSATSGFRSTGFEQLGQTRSSSSRLDEFDAVRLHAVDRSGGRMRIDRVERVHRALGDEGDLGQPVPAHLLFGEGEEIDAVEQDLAADDLTGRLDQAHDREGDGRLARAGLADQPEALARVQREADAVDRLDRAARRSGNGLPVPEHRASVPRLTISRYRRRNRIVTRATRTMVQRAWRTRKGWIVVGVYGREWERVNYLRFWQAPNGPDPGPAGHPSPLKGRREEVTPPLLRTGEGVGGEGRFGVAFRGVRVNNRGEGGSPVGWREDDELPGAPGCACRCSNLTSS